MCTLFCSNSISSLKCKTATAPEIKHTCSGSRGFYKTIRHRLLHGINIVRFQSWDRFGHFITRRPSLASPSDHFVNPPPLPLKKRMLKRQRLSVRVLTHTCMNPTTRHFSERWKTPAPITSGTDISLCLASTQPLRQFWLQLKPLKIRPELAAPTPWIVTSFCAQSD